VTKRINSFNQVRTRNKSLKEVAENFQHLHKRVKFTSEPHFRYLILEDLLNTIFKIFESEIKISSVKIKNSNLVNDNDKKIKINLQQDYKFCLVTREIMDTLLEGISADYIIKIPYTSNTVELTNAIVIEEDEYFSKKKEKINNFDTENNIEHGVLFNKDLNIIYPSVHQNLDEEKSEPNKILQINKTIQSTKKKKNFKLRKKIIPKLLGISKSTKSIAISHHCRRVNHALVNTCVTQT